MECMMMRQTLFSVTIFWPPVGGSSEQHMPSLRPWRSRPYPRWRNGFGIAMRRSARRPFLALAELGPAAKAAIPDLAKVLRDPDRYVATDAGRILEKMGADAVPSVVEMLQDPDPRVRELAVRTLQQIGADAKAAVPALTQRLGDGDPAVRQAAIFALREMGPAIKTAILALAQRVRDPDAYIAADAAHSLGRIGPEAIPSLVPLLRDCDPRVRERAALVFRQIGSENVSSGGH